MTKSDFAASIVKHACPVCLETKESVIINTHLNKPAADKVREVNGKTIGWEYCDSCQKVIDEHGDDVVFLIEIDGEKSNTHRHDKDRDVDLVKAEDAYRTGRYVAVNRSAAERIFKFKPKGYIVFIEPAVSERLGLFRDLETTEEKETE